MDGEVGVAEQVGPFVVGWMVIVVVVGGDLVDVHGWDFGGGHEGLDCGVGAVVE